jgi:hypothetical protein
LPGVFIVSIIVFLIVFGHDYVGSNTFFSRRKSARKNARVVYQLRQLTLRFLRLQACVHVYRLTGSQAHGLTGLQDRLTGLQAQGSQAQITGSQAHRLTLKI